MNPTDNLIIEREFEGATATAVFSKPLRSHITRDSKGRYWALLNCTTKPHRNTWVLVDGREVGRVVQQYFKPLKRPTHRLLTKV